MIAILLFASGMYFLGLSSIGFLVKDARTRFQICGSAALQTVREGRSAAVSIN